MRIIHLFNNLQNIKEVVEETAAVLESGGVVAYPTDTLYGLGANALNADAIIRVFNIKKRSLAKPIGLIAKDRRWVKELAYVRGDMTHILDSVWPGKTTVVLPKKSIIPNILVAGLFNVGIRIPDSIFTDCLLGKFGYPLTATSANLSGQKASHRIADIIASFENEFFKPDLIINAGDLPLSHSSTVLDLSGNKPKILRVGAAKPDELMQLLTL